MSVPRSSSSDRTRRVALVTGGSSNIGAGTARRLDRDGCAVAVNYRSAETADDAEHVVETIRHEGGDAVAYEADIGDEVAVGEQ